MTDDLNAIELWATSLLAKLQPAQRRAVLRRVGQDLRRSQAQRITAQRQPDGARFTPRASKGIAAKKGRIKRQMFAKLRTAQHLKIQSDDSQLSIGFIGRVARIARVHQEGLTERIGKAGPDYKYPSRVLIGFSASDRDLIQDSLLRHLQA